MKLNKPAVKGHKNNIVYTTEKKTTAAKAGETVELWHSQSVKLSKNYQSADASYGVKITVANDDESIKAGIARAEKIVEAPLTSKVQEQNELLNSLA